MENPPFDKEAMLGRVDEFNQAQARSETYDGAEVSGSFFASECDTLEAFETTEALLDTGAGLVECFREEDRLIFLVALVRDDRGDTTRSGSGSVGPAGIAFVGDDGARFNVRADVEQDIEMTRIRSLPASQVESDQVSGIVGFPVDFCREPAARAAERLALLPPFAPAAETWARTIVESNIWIKCADELMEARVSKKASNTPALLRRSNLFHTLFQWPNSLGRARQRTFSTVKKCNASRKRRSSAALRPRRGRQARNTVSVCAQSSSLICVDTVPTSSCFSRSPMNHNRFREKSPKIFLAKFVHTA